MKEVHQLGPEAVTRRDDKVEHARNVSILDPSQSSGLDDENGMACSYFFSALASPSFLSPYFTLPRPGFYQA